MPDKVVLEAAAPPAVVPFRGIDAAYVLSGRVILGSHGVWAREGRRLLRTIVSRSLSRSYAEVARWILGSEPSTWKAFLLSSPSCRCTPVRVRNVSRTRARRCYFTKRQVLHNVSHGPGWHPLRDLLIAHIYTKRCKKFGRKKWEEMYLLCER